MERLFALILSEVSLTGLRAQVLEEVELLCEQRPIQDQRIRDLIALAEKLPSSEAEDETQARLRFLQDALRGPSPGARLAPSLGEYRGWLRDSKEEDLTREVEVLAEAMCATGLVCRHHAVLLRFAAAHRPGVIAAALGLPPDVLRVEEEQRVLVHQLIRAAIFPGTANAIYGLAGLVGRGLLQRRAVRGGLRKLVELRLTAEAKAIMRSYGPEEEALSENSVLVAGAISMLGQPLGIGQGNAPTCQAARGLSLWSLHAPGELLGMIASAARDGFIETKFEGTILNSKELPETLRADGLFGLDPISRLLVPHLDRIYARMIQLASYRGDDVHRWVNPEMYGRWVHTGFANVIDPGLGHVDGHRRFVRQFFASHHPEYNEGHELLFPNPVGILVTDVNGTLLGPHAVSIQRVARAPEGEIRVFFFNPNNEGRQDWGQGIRPQVAGHGERHGESSLPFAHFASRLYAFHFDPYEQGELYAVPAEEVEAVYRLARESWGQSYRWVEAS